MRGQAQSLEGQKSNWPNHMEFLIFRASLMKQETLGLSSKLLQYGLPNVLYGCKMALRTLDFSQVKPKIAMLRERRARAPEAAWALLPWCDRKARCACFAVTHLRYYVVIGPWYPYYRVNSVTHSVVSGSSVHLCGKLSNFFAFSSL